MISQSGAYSRLVSPAPYSLSGRNRFHSPCGARLRLQLVEQRHRLPAVARVDLREELFFVRIDLLGHEGLDPGLQRPDLLRMLELHGRFLSSSLSPLSYRYSREAGGERMDDRAYARVQLRAKQPSNERAEKRGSPRSP